MNEDILDDIHDLGETNLELPPEVIRKVNFLKIEANDRLKRLKQGRIILWVASAIMVVSGIVSLNMRDEVPVSVWEVAIDLAVSLGVFIGCIYWSFKKPAWAFSVALGYFLLVMAISAMVDVSSLYTGIAFKLVFIIILVRSIMAARDVNRYANILQKLGAPMAEVDMLRDYLPVDLTPHGNKE
ncbi:MAG: hypothetical protein Kow0027_16500 [Saprospiraceae bacterium]